MDGITLGSAVGVSEGREEGTVDGITLGSAVGVSEGREEGTVEGSAVGTSVGVMIGLAVGLVVGGVVGGEQIPQVTEQFAAISFIPQYLSFLSSIFSGFQQSQSQGLISPGKNKSSKVNPSVSAALVQSTSGLGVGSAVGNFVGLVVGDFVGLGMLPFPLPFPLP